MYLKLFFSLSKLNDENSENKIGLQNKIYFFIKKCK